MHEAEKKFKLLTVVGARPQFVKCAVLRSIFAKHNIDEVLVHTGQHYDEIMSDVFFKEFGVKEPEYRLHIPQRSHGAMTGYMLSEVEKILLDEKPDACIVYGDTNSTLAGALASTKLHIPVFHVEAGLRSYNKKMPEEINRIMTDHISSLLFCSSQQGVVNLQNEGITQNVHDVGDIMYDAVKIFTKQKNTSKIIKSLYLKEDDNIALLTIHRAESLKDANTLKNIIKFVIDYAKNYKIIFPAHPNTRLILEKYNIDCDSISIIDPLSYCDFHALIKLSSLILTDSGGLQKEAYFHRTPCITLRSETEWVETIEAGWNVLWDNPVFNTRKEITSYGNGNSATNIINIIKEFFKETQESITN